MFMFQFLRVTTGMTMHKKLRINTPVSLYHSFSLIATTDKTLVIILLSALVTNSSYT